MKSEALKSASKHAADKQRLQSHAAAKSSWSGLQKRCVALQNPWQRFGLYHWLHKSASHNDFFRVWMSLWRWLGFYFKILFVPLTSGVVLTCLEVEGPGLPFSEIRNKNKTSLRSCIFYLNKILFLCMKRKTILTAVNTECLFKSWGKDNEDSIV